MAIVGQVVSHYRVIRKLGSGGMGVVFEAEDTRLNRRVALKFLPDTPARSARSVERFQREAQAASALNHPNICSIYDVGQHEGESFIVMELLEGETLRNRLHEHPLDLNSLLDLAIQMTDGLRAAHAKGIIHRDLKPENLFITSLGQAKILDFGLAKLTPTDSIDCVAAEGMSTLTLDESLTNAGAAMGTIAYMSPEQALGEKLDVRTDLFSLGVVLYEMATGRQAFVGNTTAAVYDAVLNRPPAPPLELNPSLPPRLEEIIAKALEKDRDLRYQVVTDLRADLKRLKRDTESDVGLKVQAHPWRAVFRPRTKRVGSRFSIRRRWIYFAVVTLLLIAVSASWWYVRRQPQGLPEVKMRQLTFNSSNDPVRGGTLSPDGKYLAYADRQGIHIMVIATGENRLIPQPQGLATTYNEFSIAGWFPDASRFLVNLDSPDLASVVERPSIWVVSVLGGPPRKLRDDADSCSVSPDGSLITFNTMEGRVGEIWVMKSTGEDARKLYESDEHSHIFCGAFLPDGERFLASSSRGPEAGPDLQQICDLKGSPPRTVFSLPRLNDITLLRDGRLIYSQQEEDNGGNCNFWEMRLSADGGPISKPRRLTNWAGFCTAHTSATADGKRLAFSENRGQGNVFVGVIDRSATSVSGLKQLTFSGEWNGPQAWTPDSKAVIFVSSQGSGVGIYRQALDSNAAEALVTGPDNYVLPRVSPDGHWLLYDVSAQNAKPDTPDRFMRIPMAGGPPEPVFTLPVSDVHCARTPATWCVLSQRTSDLKQLIWRAFDPVKGVGKELVRINTEPNVYFAWDLSPDSRYIALIQRLGEGTIRVLSLTDGSRREIGVKGWSELEDVKWRADGKGLFATTRTRRVFNLLGIDFEGNAHVLWTQRGAINAEVVPSPDGRHLAIFANTLSENMWMMENF